MTREIIVKEDKAKAIFSVFAYALLWIAFFIPIIKHDFGDSPWLWLFTAPAGIAVLVQLHKLRPNVACLRLNDSGFEAFFWYRRRQIKWTDVGDLQIREVQSGRSGIRTILAITYHSESGFGPGKRRQWGFTEWDDEIEDSYKESLNSIFEMMKPRWLTAISGPMGWPAGSERKQKNFSSMARDHDAEHPWF